MFLKRFQPADLHAWHLQSSSAKRKKAAHRSTSRQGCRLAANIHRHRSAQLWGRSGCLRLCFSLKLAELLPCSTLFGSSFWELVFGVDGGVQSLNERLGLGNSIFVWLDLFFKRLNLEDCVLHKALKCMLMIQVSVVLVDKSLIFS